MAVQLTFSESLPTDSPATKGLFFQFEPTFSWPRQWELGDTRKLIREKEDQWLKQLEEWHVDLSNRAASISPLWWLMPASRITSWIPANAEKLFFAMALIEVLEKSGETDAYAVGCPEEVLEYISEMRPHWTLVRTMAREPSPSVVRHQKIKVLRRLVDFITRTTRNTFRKIQESDADIVVYSHAMNCGNLSASGDHFFAHALDDLKTTPNGKKAEILWYYLFATNDGSSRKDIRTVVESSGAKTVFVDELIGWREALNLLRLCVRTKVAAAKIRATALPLTVDAFKSSLFLKNWLDPQLTNYLPFNELLILIGTTRLLRKIQPKCLLYPYEEKALEHALLQAVKINGNEKTLPPVRTVGFAHAVHNYGHMYMRNRRSKVPRHPLPDFIGTTGPTVRDWLISWGEHPTSHLKVMGSPRYSAALPPPLINDAKLREVVVIISSAHELPALAALVECQPSALHGWVLVIRRYPYGWYEIQDKAISRLEKLGITLRVEAGPIKEQFSRVHAVAFCSSSAGFEAMLAGRISIRLNLNEVLDLDPMAGRGDGSSIFKADNILELKQALDEIAALDSSAYANRAEQQRKYAIGIYSPPAFASALGLEA